MPEGPEIRRAADQITRAIAGQPLDYVEFAFPTLKRYQKSLEGARVEAFTPHGKALLTRFDNGLTLYSHNQLYGVWRIVRAGSRPATNRSLRVVLETEKHAALLYSASEIEIWPTPRIHEHPFLKRIGPDILDPTLTAQAVLTRLEGTRFHARSLAALLLDQSFLAGMGNYLRSEVLFEAGVLPAYRPRDLEPAARERLAQALLDVPRRSYAHRGKRRRSTPAERAARENTHATEGFRLCVFDRQEQPCFACGSAIQRVELAGRRLYLCPNCQI